MPKIKNTRSQLMHQICEQDEWPPLIGDPTARPNNQDLFFVQNLALLHSPHRAGFVLCKEENLIKPKLRN